MPNPFIRTFAWCLLVVIGVFIAKLYTFHDGAFGLKQVIFKPYEHTVSKLCWDGHLLSQ